MSKDTRPGKRIVLHPFGSLGDVHPFIAIGIGLKERGHTPVIATHASMRGKIEAERIEFHAIRPDPLGTGEAAEIVRQAMESRRGPENVIRAMLSHLRESYDDLIEVLPGADLVITHPIAFAGPIAAEKSGVRWASTALSPLSMFSQHDPPIIPGYRFLSLSYRRSRSVRRSLQWLTRAIAGPWFEPVYELRAELGLPPDGIPILTGQRSPDLMLALFSEVLGAPQPDWPPNAHVTGFCFYDKHESGGLSPELERFLHDGPAPIIFTLGSAACMSPGDFYRESIQAARKLGRRAVLLTGMGTNEDIPDGMIACGYAPYSALFPRACAIVHHAGVGTTGQTLRAGRPMLVVPFSQDQPDNAARATRLGAARTIPRKRYTVDRAAAELRALLEDSVYARKAEEIGCRIRAEDGVAAACDAIEELLGMRASR